MAPSSNTTPEIPIIPLTTTPSPTIISQLVTLHQRSILHDNALMRFHPPFDEPKTQRMHEWWEKRLADVGCPAHHLFIAMAPPTDPAAALLTSGAPSSSGGQTTEAQVVGMVELLTPTTDTGHFRAELEMLMIDPSFRGRKLARHLNAAIESLAISLNRTLITLSTTEGSDADRFVYPNLGYTVFGRLPGYGEVPDGSGRRANGVYYYKDLRGMACEGRVEGGWREC